MKYRRILILGISGTGKTHLAKRLSGLLYLPVYYLDTYTWKENWVEAPMGELEKSTRRIIANDQWVIEGFINPCAKEKIERADIVLYLDYPGWRAFLGGFRRWWQFKGRVRPEMPTGNTEKFDWPYLMVMLKRGERPEIENEVGPYSERVVRLTSPRAVSKFIKTLV